MKEKRQIEVNRVETNPLIGLSDEQIDERVKAGATNKMKKIIGKSYPQIFLSNFCNVFNLFIIVLAILLIYCEEYTSLFFAVIYTANLIIGLVNDIRARRLLEKMTLITQTNVLSIRNGKTQEININDIVLDDLLILKAGNEVPVDGIIREGQVGVNESNLTGESMTVYKTVGDEILSGSYVVSGEVKIQADRVGKNSYVSILERKAKKKKAVKTELKASLDSFFYIIIILVLSVTILGTIALFQQFQNDFKGSFGTFAGSLISMIPSGLYLLSSVTLTVGVINLVRKHALVQDYYAIETLARSDTLCLDKTGTLTDGTMEVKEIVSIGTTTKNDLTMMIVNTVKATKDDNATAAAIKKHLDLMPNEKAIYACPFASENKYSFATFATGTIVLGAFEFMNAINANAARPIVDDYSAKGYRVLAVGKSFTKEMGKKLTSAVEIVGLIVLQDHIKDDAKETLEWFKNNNVAIRIISGDNALTVSHIAQEVGVVDADKYISLEGMSIEDVKIAAKKYIVFGRVTPDQKEAIVESLKEEKRTVAMVGDGVNDILALKKSDCSIAMKSGSDAAKNASQLVLLDSNFSSLPSVVAEGRRAINNLKRTCSLFFVKTIFATLISFTFIGFAFYDPTIPMPYYTNHLYLWEFTIIGGGSFFLALEPCSEAISKGFIKQVFKQAIPAGIIVYLSSMTYYILWKLQVHDIMHSGIYSEDQFLTMSVLTFVIIPLCHFFYTCRPFTKYRFVVFLAAVIFDAFALGMIVLMEYNMNYTDLFKISFKSMLPFNYVVSASVCFGGIVLFCICNLIIDGVKKYYLSKKELAANANAN